MWRNYDDVGPYQIPTLISCKIGHVKGVLRHLTCINDFYRRCDKKQQPYCMRIQCYLLNIRRFIVRIEIMSDKCVVLFFTCSFIFHLASYWFSSL